VIGDPNRLQQVIWNLLSNAVKFTPQGGVVEVVLAQRDGRVEAQVRDDGIGIAPDFLDHVFDRFRQADSSTTRSHGGLGLGLAIVRHLVELHGGTVEAASDGEGRGSTFTVRLPVAPGLSSGAEPPAVTAEPLMELSGVKVLLVDDEPGAREVLPAVLELFGADVQVSASAPEALEALRHFAPDVLVSDIAMPGEDGYSLIGKIRALEGDSRLVPAIALTAYAGDGDRRKALEAGFQLHLAKPIEPRDLVTAVASMAREAVRER
jgi:CheY-like chemotaxis protein/anti-sigma regulatory factor (Ser/Thr protein kinase)